MALGGEDGDDGIQGQQLIEILIPLRADAGDGGEGGGAGLLGVYGRALRVIDGPVGENADAEAETAHQKNNKEEYQNGRSIHGGLREFDGVEE